MQNKQRIKKKTYLNTKQNSIRVNQQNRFKNQDIEAKPTVIH